MFVFTTQCSEGVCCIAAVCCVPGHVCVKPAGCGGSAARYWHCLGCGITDSNDVSLSLFLNLRWWEWCTLLEQSALGHNYLSHHGVGVFKISCFNLSPLRHVFSPWMWRAAYSTPFLLAEIFYILEACYHVSLKTFVLHAEQLPFVFSLLMAVLFSSWMTHGWLILPLEVPFSPL